MREVGNCMMDIGTGYDPYTNITKYWIIDTSQPAGKCYQELTLLQFQNLRDSYNDWETLSNGVLRRVFKADVEIPKSEPLNVIQKELFL